MSFLGATLRTLRVMGRQRRKEAIRGGTYQCSVGSTIGEPKADSARCTFDEFRPP